MATSPPPPTESTSRARRALTTGAVATLSYFAFGLIIYLFPPLQASLGWLWLLLSGPGYLVVSLLQPLLMTPFHWAFVIFSGAALCFAVAGSSTYSRRLRWAIVLLWAVIAFCTTALGLLLSIAALGEPLPLSHGAGQHL